MKPTIAETFDDHWIERVGPLDTPCHIWQRCKTGLGYGQQHPHAKLTETAVAFARRNYVRGHPKYNLAALASLFGVTQQTMHGAIIGRSWKHV